MLSVCQRGKNLSSTKPRAFLCLWTHDLVVKSLLCLAKSLLCVHMQFACAQIFQKRPWIFQLCFGIIFQGVFFFPPQNHCLLKASLGTVDA